MIYRENFNFVPRIAVLGLNPHCESINKISEEKDSKITSFFGKISINHKSLIFSIISSSAF